MIKKNKPVTIFLLVSVIAIYGVIIYRSFSVGNQKNEDVFGLSVKNNEMINVNYHKDSFKINSFLRDPFGSSGFSSINTNHSEIIDKPIILDKDHMIKDPTPLIWPELKYFGYVKNKTRKKGLYLISVNNHLTKIKIGETFKEVTLFSCSRDSAVFIFGEEKRSIQK